MADREFLLAAIALDGKALRFASAELQADAELLNMAKLSLNMAKFQARREKAALRPPMPGDLPAIQLPDNSAIAPLLPHEA